MECLKGACNLYVWHVKINECVPLNNLNLSLPDKGEEGNRKSEFLTVYTPLIGRKCKIVNAPIIDPPKDAAQLADEAEGVESQDTDTTTNKTNDGNTDGNANESTDKNADEDTDENILETANMICKKVDDFEFDGAIISAGAYSCLIADYILKHLKKEVFVIGGNLSFYFGIITKRDKIFHNNEIL